MESLAYLLEAFGGDEAAGPDTKDFYTKTRAELEALVNDVARATVQGVAAGFQSKAAEFLDTSPTPSHAPTVSHSKPRRPHLPLAPTRNEAAFPLQAMRSVV